MNIQQPIKPARGCKAWSGKDIAELLEMSAAGFTDQDIADAIGRSAKAVGLRRQRLVNQVTDAKVNKPTRRRGKIDKPTPAQIQESADRYFGIDPEPELSDDWVDTFALDTSGSITKEEAETFTSPVQSSSSNDDSYHLSIPKTVVRIALVAGAIAAGIQIGMYI
jgi:hypothetical protein